MLVLLKEVIGFFGRFNLVDWGVILIIILYGIEGYAVGAISGLLDICGFLVAFSVGFILYKPLGGVLSGFIHLPEGFLHAIGFLFVVVMIEILIRIVLFIIMPFVRRLPWPNVLLQVNHFVGIFPGMLAGLVLLSFLLTVITILPLSNTLKQMITSSVVGNILVAQSQDFEKGLANVFGGKPDDLLTFLTVEPQTNAMVHLDFKVSNGKMNEISEQQMLVSVNKERTSRGLSALELDTQLQTLARSHSGDMLSRSYFSHFTPEGKSPFDRMNDANISYQYAGENLAFSANTDLAMQGLMQSAGHRANILSPNFHRIGIGVINAGIYGQMFSQEFTD